MAVPKRRRSKMRVRTGRANKGMSKPSIMYCQNCKSAALPHRVCANCGQYQGRVIVDTEEK